MQNVSEYESFAALAADRVEGRDFDRLVRPVPGARVAIVAPHGGCIEPHSDEIASEVAGAEFSLYCFRSHVSQADANLHITSHRFDDPLCVDLVARHDCVVAIHGWGAKGERMTIGGRDTVLVDRLAAAARNCGIDVMAPTGSLAGLHRQNICNRGRSKQGVQVELTMALRSSKQRVALVDAFRSVLLGWSSI